MEAIRNIDLVSLLDTGVSLVTAFVLGAAIGLERQYRQRTAGLRTNVLVAVGAAVFVDMANRLGGREATVHVLAYVVSGIGFLGAGVIMREEGNVRGLNTAATLWCSAAVGACVGAGEALDAVFVAILLIAVNSVLRPLSRWIDQRSLAVVEPYVLFGVRVVGASVHHGEMEQHITRAIAKRSLNLQELRSEEEEGETVVQLVLESATRDDKLVREMAAELRTCPWLKSIDVTGFESESAE